MLKGGIPASKLLLGIPAYAREMNHPQEVKTYEEMYRLGTQTLEAIALTGRHVSCESAFCLAVLQAQSQEPGRKPQMRTSSR